MLILNKSKGPIPEGAVYVGRPSPFGNPYTIGKDGTREEVIQKYRAWFRHQLKTSDTFLVIVERLRTAKGLVCWCAPHPCHADVIVEYLKTGQV